MLNIESLENFPFFLIFSKTRQVAQKKRVLLGQEKILILSTDCSIVYDEIFSTTRKLFALCEFLIYTFFQLSNLVGYGHWYIS